MTTTVRGLFGTIALLSIAMGLVSLGLTAVEALTGLGCASCSDHGHVDSPHDFWGAAAATALLLSIGLLVISTIVAAVVKTPLSPHRTLRAFRAIIVAGVAFVVLCAGVAADVLQHDAIASVLRVLLYIATLATIVAAIAAIVVRTPPAVPPARVAE